MNRDWHEVKRTIDKAIDKVWIEEPAEVTRIKWGIIEGGAGTGGQYFTTLVLLETYTLLLGQRVLYSLMMIANKPETDLPMMKMITKSMISESFHATEFLADLGLYSMHDLGTEYLEALDNLESKEEYMELTGSLMTYVNRMHRWIHYIFPWNLGVMFPQRTPQEFKMLSTIFN